MRLPGKPRSPLTRIGRPNQPPCRRGVARLIRPEPRKRLHPFRAAQIIDSEFRMRRCVAAILGFLLVSAAQAQEFPYDRDLVLDARPMRGSKRVPILSIDTSGRAQI